MLPWFQNGAYPLYLAPMARFTDRAFRQLCKEQGADVMVTEFVMADGLLSGEHAWRTLDFTEEQRPMGVQIFGSNREKMAEAARRVEQRLRPDFIDINCGCPADKVTDQLAGSSLLRDPQRLADITGAVVRAVPETPVTVKIRIGWDADSIVATDVGQAVQAAGAQALAIHGRTKEQGYSGQADWAVIDSVAAQLDIPVIGNGDVSGVRDVVRLRRESPVRGLMIGRAALGYPWLFSEIKHYLATGEIPTKPTPEVRWATILRFAELLLTTQYAHKTPDDIRWMRAKLKALTKDMTGSRKVRAALDTIVSMDDLKALAVAQIENQKSAAF